MAEKAINPEYLKAFEELEKERVGLKVQRIADWKEPEAFPEGIVKTSYIRAQALVNKLPDGMEIRLHQKAKRESAETYYEAELVEGNGPKVTNGIYAKVIGDEVFLLYSSLYKHIRSSYDWFKKNPSYRPQAALRAYILKIVYAMCPYKS